MAEFAARHIVKSGHQRRLINIAQPLGSGLSEGKPVMPVAHGILKPLEFGNQLRGSSGFWSELRCVTGALYDDAVAM